MYRRTDKKFTETVLAVSLHFQHIGLNLQENQVHHSKEHKTVLISLAYKYRLQLSLTNQFPVSSDR
jgi:hypothetical protein